MPQRRSHFLDSSSVQQPQQEPQHRAHRHLHRQAVQEPAHL